jgi:hypothetical protein
VHLKIGVLADERSRGARVVEVDVAQEQVAEVLQPDPVVGETAFERRKAARRTAVMERETVLGLEQVGADDALGALVAEVD